MRRAPTCELPESHGPWVTRESCTETDGVLSIDGSPLTGVVVTLIDGSPSNYFDRCRLDQYVDGTLTREFVDGVNGIDTSVCVEFTDDHYSVEFPPQATAIIQFHSDVSGDCLLASAGHSAGDRLFFDPAGILTGVDRRFGTEGELASHWRFDPDGQIQAVGVRNSHAQTPPGLSASFDGEGRISGFKIEGNSDEVLVHAADHSPDLWLPARADELFEFEASPDFTLPRAPEHDAKILSLAPTWLADVRNLDLSGAVRFGFARALIGRIDLTSLALGALSPGRNTFLHGDDNDDHELLQLACDFMRTGGQRAEIDHCLLGSTDSEPAGLLEPYRGTMVFDPTYTHLVGLNSAFLRPIHLDLIHTSEQLEFVRIFSGRQDNKDAALEPSRLSNPSARFETERGEATDDSFNSWLHDTCGR